MNIYHIKYFLDAARSSSMSASAQKNNITHSAISQAIKNLELELGIELLNHNKRKFELTDAGKSSLAYLEELLVHLQKVKSQLKNTLAEPSGELIVWAPQSLIVDSLIESFIEFQEKYPRVHLTIHTGAAFLVRQKVAENSCHLGISINDQKMKNLDSLNISKGEFVLVSAKKKTNIHQNQLLTTSLEKVEVQHLFNENIRLNLPDFSHSTQIISWGLIKEFALRGHGTGYVPEYVVKNELKQKKLFKVSYNGRPFKYEVLAIWNKKMSLDRNARLLLDIMNKRIH